MLLLFLRASLVCLTSFRPRGILTDERAEERPVGLQNARDFRWLVSAYYHARPTCWQILR